MMSTDRHLYVAYDTGILRNNGFKIAIVLLCIFAWIVFVHRTQDCYCSVQRSWVRGKESRGTGKARGANVDSVSALANMNVNEYK